MANGVKWGLLVACLSALPALWYGWVYGIGPVEGTLVDSAHLATGPECEDDLGALVGDRRHIENPTAPEGDEIGKRRRRGDQQEKQPCRHAPEADTHARVRTGQ